MQIVSVSRAKITQTRTWWRWLASSSGRALFALLRRGGPSIGNSRSKCRLTPECPRGNRTIDVTIRRSASPVAPPLGSFG